MTGATLLTGMGNVGKNAYRIMMAEGDGYYGDVWTLDVNPFPENEIKHIQVDLTDRWAVEQALNGKKFNRVIHTAAVLLPQKSYAYKMPDINYQVNVGGTLNLLSGLYKNEHPIESFCVIGSGSIYDTSKIEKSGATEETPLTPVESMDSYARSKLLQVEHAKEFVNKYFPNAKFTSPWYALLYGPEDRWFLGVGAQVDNIASLLDAKTVPWPDAGEFGLGVLCGENAADATLYIERHGKHNQKYNVCGMNLTIRDMMGKVAEKKGIDLHTEDEALEAGKNLQDTSYALLVNIPSWMLIRTINMFEEVSNFAMRLNKWGLEYPLMSLELTSYVIGDNTFNSGKLKKLGWEPRVDEQVELGKMVDDRLKNERGTGDLLKGLGMGSEVVKLVDMLSGPSLSGMMDSFEPAMLDGFRSGVLEGIESLKVKWEGSRKLYMDASAFRAREKENGPKQIFDIAKNPYEPVPANLKKYVNALKLDTSFPPEYQMH